jgi:hypothetical protein
MASGHEYRTRRPNTWLLRPTPQVKILLANPEPMVWTPPLPRWNLERQLQRRRMLCRSFG